MYVILLMRTDGTLTMILLGIIISGEKPVGLKKICPKNVYDINTEKHA